MSAQQMPSPLAGAQWIWAPNIDDKAETPSQFVLFRRALRLDGPLPPSCIVHVSADTRYRLFVNGNRASFGPCKSYPARWYYETVDIGPFLKTGVNVLAVRVLRLSPETSSATSIMRTSKPGMILHCTAGNIIIHSDESWKTYRDGSVHLVPNADWDFRLGPPFVSLWERADGRLKPHGWLDASFDDTKWHNAVPSTMAAKMAPILDSRKLIPRSIPALPEIPSTFDGVVCCAGGPTKTEWEALLDGGKPIHIEPQSTVTVDIESNELTTGFFELSLDQDGQGSATITILAAECYEGDMDQGVARSKGDRTNSQHGKLYGPADTYISHPGRNDYSPFWWRAFRYLRLTITPTTSPLTLRSFRYRATHYPLPITTTLTATTPSPHFTKLSHLWQVSVTTLRNCMHETFEDCPYYEQNQFAMDARLQMLFSYALSSDGRLARKTICEFAASRRDDGLLEAQFPCAPCRMTGIPAFSLYWVLMVRDHWVQFGDRGLVRESFGVVDGVLEYFARLVRVGDGLVGRLEAEGEEEASWAFVDWVGEWKTPAEGFKGMAVPPAYFKCGAATVHSLLYAIALQSAAELADCTGRGCVADEYRSRAAELNSAVRRHCFDPETGLFTDGPGSKDRSQHAQVLAVLSGAASAEEAPVLMRRAVVERERHGIARTSLAMAFYVFRAASLAGVYEELWDDMIKPWEVMLSQNLTTWAEFETNPRSDCHGWSATPIYEIVREIVGVKLPEGDIDGAVVIQPRVKMVPALKGSFVAGGGRVLDISWSGGSLCLTSSVDMVVELRLGKGSRLFALERDLSLQTSLDAIDME
ncbi:glycoside hydrolase family 78 protein [Parathielavia appendiculata]|uniref:Glycoside hydrolase family 78 protein n=1 Tax=Parathielavia appendiculata TaxID=2587402 RepID=A0AAN6Z762_9PEZI|nr:glycoside hydrolase family 78 protein [Parathielavia appendiculata]